ncbi:dsRBD fold-containing protein [Oryzobacter sp. R7]|uniref:dsRBD fold-containing protein n=1 Tax=Oryzobacter faecalis TaxID=3388656 RepID=UPI00398CA917
MRADRGDRIILAGEHVDNPTRAGEVLGCGADGGPPYTVRWDDGHTSTLFPGPGSVLRVLDAGAQPETVPEATPTASGVLREWTVRVTIFERGDDTTATVALLADDPDALTARGTSHRGPEDAADSRIGDEVAVARALRHLADQLMATAERDIEASTGEQDVLVRAL